VAGGGGGGGASEKDTSGGGGAGGGKGAAGATDNAAATADPKATAGTGVDSTKKPAEASSSFEIVWLPDYCQQYAIDLSSGGASTKSQLQFADGWQLTSFNSEVNNTEILRKMFDAVASVAGTSADAAQKVAVAGIQAAGTGAKSAAGAQAANPTTLFRRTDSTILKPGIYALVNYPGDNCSLRPTFGLSALDVVTTTTWSEVVLDKGKAGEAALGDAAAVVPGPAARDDGRAAAKGKAARKAMPTR
jgi:hypothetical protein